MAAQVTPETQEFLRLLREEENEQRILNYLNQHVGHIDLAYRGIRGGLVLLALPKNRNVAVRLLDLGATVPTDLYALSSRLSRGFEQPLAVSRSLMLTLIEKGFSKNDMLILLCNKITEIHLNLMSILHDLGNIDYNYMNPGNFWTYKPLGKLLGSYDHENRDTFIQMLRFLVKNGANPNLSVEQLGRTAYQLLEWLNIPNEGPIRRILDQYQPPAPVAQAQDYQKLWWEELKKKEPNLQKIREYAPHVNLNAVRGVESPLLIAIKGKNLELVKTLLDLGANPQPRGANHIFMYAVNDAKIGDPHNTNLQILEELRKKGANFSILINGSNIYFYCLNVVAGEGKLLSYFKYFQPYVDIKQKNERGYTVLEEILEKTYTMDSHYTKLEKFLINQDVSLETKSGKSIIAYYKSADIVNTARLDVIFSKVQDGNYMAEHILKRAVVLSASGEFGEFGVRKVQFDANTLSVIMFNILKYNPDVKKVYSDGSTMLILLAKIINLKNDDRVGRNGKDKFVNLFDKIIKLGADPNYVDPSGKTAADYATDDAVKEFLESFAQARPSTAWTGFTKADIAFTNEVFHQVIHSHDLAIRNPDTVLFSMCPVCLKYIEHASGSCMYMTHSCVEQAGFQGYYHMKLWNTYSYEKQLYDPQGRLTGTKRLIEWCTLCGRICKGHRHYQLARLFKTDGKTLNPPPDFAGEGDFFAIDCSKPSIGGGGLKEKVNRYRRFREVVLFLNQQVGQISFQKAIDTLVEEMWEAPLASRRLEVNYALQKKAYNAAVANSLFPVPQAELNAVYANVAYPNASNTNLQPLVFATADATHKNVWEHLSADEENIIQFRHRMADGTINEHAGPNQQIALDNLIGYVKEMTTQQASDDFGLCWQHANNYLTILTDEAHPPPKCTARLYPQEVLAAIEGSTYTDPEMKEKHLQIYNAYRVAFNKKFGSEAPSEAPSAAVGGGPRRRKTLKGRRTLRQTKNRRA